jgi:peptidoglycan/xylan/chitin deacetylase (PgdA/CDA1 family)
MHRWKRLLLSAYVAGSMPYRRRAARQAEAEGRAPIVVLFYHRVADDYPNPWTISCSSFTWQIEWLTRNVDVISLAEAQRRMREQDSRRPAACITFDDGYADNCRHALPLLVKQRIPFTYFVSTHYVLERRPFPHDADRGRPLEPNTLEQLRALANAGAEVGAHTSTHPDLGRIHDPDRLREEVIASADTLAEIVGRPMRYFAFPFGQRENLNREVFHLARQYGFAGVCSAYGGYNLPGDDAFHLQRVHADPEPARFVNWLTIDPRKRRLPRFDVAPALAAPDPEEAPRENSRGVETARRPSETSPGDAPGGASAPQKQANAARDESPAAVGAHP